MMHATSASSVLFLQGPPSPFWCQLADTFESSGATTTRVNFSAGDQLYWRKRGAINFRRRIGSWAAFLEKLIVERKITDIVYYADRLPYHRIATEVAARLGVKCHAVEFGYLRPDWVTLERDGMGGYSHFPHEPEQIRKIAAEVGKPDLEVRYQHKFEQEAVNEVIYNLTAYFGRPLFPFYKADKYYDPLLDYISWLRRFVQKKRTVPAEYIEAGAPPFYLITMQLQSDYQIRSNSAYRHLSEMIEQVVASFTAHASKDSRLLVKQHPLDNNWERWDQVLARVAKRHGVADRVVFIDDGDLGSILKQTRGVVVVNSTVGLHSLRVGVPTIALGTAIYDIPGLTHQSGLDSFWTSPEPVDMGLLDDFVAAMAGTIQVKGNFYHREGRDVAAAAIVERVINGRVNMPGAFVEVPPRLQSIRASAFLPARVRRTGAAAPVRGLWPEATISGLGLNTAIANGPEFGDAEK